MIRKECYILTVKSRFDCSNIKTKKVNEKKKTNKSYRPRVRGNSYSKNKKQKVNKIFIR